MKLWDDFLIDNCLFKSNKQLTFDNYFYTEIMFDYIKRLYRKLQGKLTYYAKMALRYFKINLYTLTMQEYKK